jgi:hypothetical protein
MKVVSISDKDAAELNELMDEVTKAQGACSVAKYKVVELTNRLCKMAGVEPKLAVLSDDGHYLTVDDTADKPLIMQFDTAGN